MSNEFSSFNRYAGEMKKLWPEGTDDLRAAYNECLVRAGKAKAVTEMSAVYGLGGYTVRRRLADAGVRPMAKARESMRPESDVLAAAWRAAVAEHGERASVSNLAATYGVTTVTIRQWLADSGLRAMTARIPPKPITDPCPCGAVATTRYKGEDPALCFKCYMRRYASDDNPGFHRTAREYIAEVKRNAACADCGGKFPAACMHFDHVPERGPKLFNIGNGDYAIEAVKTEIAKCDIVCANCHAIRTWTTRKKPKNAPVTPLDAVS